MPLLRQYIMHAYSTRTLGVILYYNFILANTFLKFFAPDMIICLRLFTTYRNSGRLAHCSALFTLPLRLSHNHNIFDIV